MSSDYFLKDLHLPPVFPQTATEKPFTKEQWESGRRKEILELFRKYVYGKNPVERPEKMWFEVIDIKEGMMDGKAVRKRIKICYEGPGGTGGIDLTLFVPAHADGPVPAFLLICNRDRSNIDPDRNIKSSFWPAEQIIDRGYAAAAFHNSDVDPDKNDFSDGVHAIFETPGEPRPADAWGSIGAWAWGASRVMDYFETDPAIDSGRVAVAGHSRGGKTALWCGAQDERFKLVISNNSGTTGAALSRENRVESVELINTRFPHWFCRNYKSFNNRVYELPVDQHMLLALISPRYLYVASASEDKAADIEAEFRACVEAAPAYEIYGLCGLESDCMPEPEKPLLKGGIAYHVRRGEHNLTEYDWKCFMDFADMVLK